MCCAFYKLWARSKYSYIPLNIKTLFVSKLQGWFWRTRYGTSHNKLKELFPSPDANHLIVFQVPNILLRTWDDDKQALELDLRSCSMKTFSHNRIWSSKQKTATCHLASIRLIKSHPGTEPLRADCFIHKGTHLLGSMPYAFLCSASVVAFLPFAQGKQSKSYESLFMTFRSYIFIPPRCQEELACPYCLPNAC